MKLDLVKILICWLLCIGLISCLNEDDQDNQNVDIIQQKDYLVIDTTSMLNTICKDINRSVYASLFGPIMSQEQIDLNNDNIDDIEFSCSVYHHTVYDEWSAVIRTLHENVTIDVDSLTILMARYSYYIPNSSGDSIKIDYYKNYDPSYQYPPNLKISSSIEYFPRICINQYRLNENCNWQSGNLALLYNNRMGGTSVEDISSKPWGNVYHKFIGIRFSEKAKPYYGWIELSVHDYTISLQRYGIQKDALTSDQRDTITDIDGNVYHAVTIGDQIWMAENLQVTHYRNGDPIETTIPEGANIGVQFLNQQNHERYYNWYAVTDPRNICPEGWHIPSSTEWETLIEFLGGQKVAGGKMKRTGTSFWKSPNSGATNESGFTALGSGYRYGDKEYVFDIGNECGFWSSTVDPNYSEGALNLRLKYNDTTAFLTGFHQSHGLSVRCIKDKN